jgi:tRNA (guanine10-N2)-dimethyltransferase
VDVLVTLSQEHPTLPAAEVRGCLEAEKPTVRERYHNEVMILSAPDGTNWQAVADRLALSYTVNEIVATTADGCMEKLKFSGGFKVVGGTEKLRKTLGEKINKQPAVHVDLERPATEINIVQHGSSCYFCRVLAHTARTRVNRRLHADRPCAAPTTLQPRLARAQVNSAGTRPGDTILDPFCGPGGILIEAGLVGMRIAGVDIKKPLVAGCRANLAHYGLEPEFLHDGDMRTVPLPDADAVVTDVPYGRAAHVSDTQEMLYTQGIRRIAEVAPVAVVGLPTLRFTRHIMKYFTIEQVHCARVHRSLTRFFYVLRR